MLDNEVSSGSSEQSVHQFSPIDSQLRSVPPCAGDRFIAKRKLDFESAFNFEKKSLVIKQDFL
jgi:hypothetical protein